MRYAKRLSLIALLLLLAISLGLTGLWQSFKSRQQIETLKLSGWSLSAKGLGIEHLELRRGPKGAQQYLRAEQLHVNAQHLLIEHLEVSVPQANTLETSPALLEDLSHVLPGWVPKALAINHLTLELPCQGLRCTLQGKVQATLDTHQQLGAQIHLTHLEHTLALALSADLKRISELHASLSVNGQSKGSLRNTLQEGLWQGELTLAPMPEFAWLLPWLNQWISSVEGLPPLPVADATLHWQITPAPALNLDALKHVSGHLSLSADIVENWQVAELGLVKGHIQAALSKTASTVSLNALNTALELNPKDAPWLSHVPEELRPSAMNLTLVQRADALTDVLEMDGALSLQGPLAGSLTGPLKLHLNAPTPYATLSGAQLILNAKTFTRQDFNAQEAALTASLEGQLSLEKITLSTVKPLRLSAKKLVLDALSAQSVSLDLTPTAAELTWTEQTLGYQAQGLLTAKAAISQPQLKAATWQWPAQLQLSPSAIELKGLLTNSHGLAADTHLTHRFNGATSISAHLRPIDFAKGNPWQKSLSAWPNSLELEKGRMALTATVQIPAKQAVKVALEGNLSTLSGLYQTSEFSGLNAPFELSLDADTLRLMSPTLSLSTLNPGVALGPLQANFSYQANRATLDQGALTLQQLQSELFDGRVWLEPQRIDLSRANPSSTLHIQGVQIQALLAAYPAEGLAGSGTLDGQLPVSLTAQGLQIANGTLNAREPGGRLQFQSNKLTALGKSNPAMQLAADALSDFRFHTLATGVSLSPQGTLQLAFNLAGYNPDLQKGRPVNFNINLEEDLPALFKSLQLSGKVSERIEQRVRQQLNAPQ